MTYRFSRRDFLRATLVSVATSSLQACANDDKGTDSATEGMSEDLLDGKAYFPQSVASGDPRPDSVILWTRVDDPDAGEGDVELELQVATDPDFKDMLELDAPSATLTAKAQFDRCAKVKLKGLQPATFYHYRFVHAREDGRYASQVGRTRTAPAAGADVPVRFVFVSCQDFNGRYYNNYRQILQQDDLDFFVHLGDYIYETTGDPDFQVAGDRQAVFSDTAGAIVFNAGTDKQYYAAKSLSNYRELYRQYRSDPALQRVHETIPMIAVWDDHEFSDDCHGATASYFDGEVDELDEDRRKRANQAWFEYMPVDFGDDGYFYDPTKPYLEDIKIYREFTFGKHLHLVMTDLRSYRSDHLIPEDALPGEVVMGAADMPVELADAASPYIEDIAAFMGGTYADALVAGAATLGYDPKKITGALDAGHVNDLLAQLGNPLPAIDDATLAGLPRGLAYLHLGKVGFYSSFGARYLVVKPVFDALARKRLAEAPASAEVMGKAQQQWFLDALRGADATWKVWGNEYCLTQLAVDLRALPVEPFNQLFYLGVDGWDGFNPKRDELIGALAGVENLVAITGDIHAFYAATPSVLADPTKKLIEFVTGAISSTTFRGTMLNLVKSSPSLANFPGAEELALSIDSLLTGVTTNPHLGFANSSEHGFVRVEVDAAELRATFSMIAEDESLVDYAGKEDALAGKYKLEKFKVNAGERELYREVGGVFKRWDPAMNAWV